MCYTQGKGNSAKDEPQNCLRLCNTGVVTYKAQPQTNRIHLVRSESPRLTVHAESDGKEPRL